MQNLEFGCYGTSACWAIFKTMIWGFGVYFIGKPVLTLPAAGEEPCHGNEWKKWESKLAVADS